MKNTFGYSLTVTVFGESHGPYIGATLDGLAPGVVIDDAYIKECLTRRRPAGSLSTARREADDYRIISGVWNGRSTGAPLTVLIPNADTHSADYSDLSVCPRPSHADYPAHCKYHGFEDYRGGGHFSGRLTAAIVAVGAIVRSALRSCGIEIATHVSSVGGVHDRPMTEADMAHVYDGGLPVLDRDAEADMREVIEAARKDGDSVGGTLETLITGLPAGVGEPMFDSMESVLSHALFSIPAVKGVSFGDGFALAAMRGSEANDPYRMKDGRVLTETNRMGGIGGGITNGMPVRVSCAIKPTPSIAKEQRTVDLSKGEDRTLAVHGRHDPCIVHRAAAVADAMCALVVADLLVLRYGTDVLMPKEDA